MGNIGRCFRGLLEASAVCEGLRVACRGGHSRGLADAHAAKANPNTTCTKASLGRTPIWETLKDWTLRPRCLLKGGHLSNEERRL